MPTYLFHKAHGAKLFADDEEAARLNGTDGWCDSPAKVNEAGESDAPDLRAEAEALGIKVDKRWGDERLTAEIAKAKAA